MGPLSLTAVISEPDVIAVVSVSSSVSQREKRLACNNLAAAVSSILAGIARVAYMRWLLLRTAWHGVVWSVCVVCIGHD